MTFYDNGPRAGFSLLEILVVVTIIAFLLGVGGLSYSLARRKAKESRTQAHLEILSIALDEYRVEFGAYPSQMSGSDISDLSEFSLLKHSTEGLVGVDPWGRAYQYESTHILGYKLWSKGADASSPEDDLYAVSRGL